MVSPPNIDLCERRIASIQVSVGCAPFCSDKQEARSCLPYRWEAEFSRPTWRRLMVLAENSLNLPYQSGREFRNKPKFKLIAHIVCVRVGPEVRKTTHAKRYRFTEPLFMHIVDSHQRPRQTPDNHAVLLCLRLLATVFQKKYQRSFGIVIDYPKDEFKDLLDV
jgi:hypothetical protein